MIEQGEWRRMKGFKLSFRPLSISLSMDPLQPRSRSVFGFNTTRCLGDFYALNCCNRVDDGSSKGGNNGVVISLPSRAHSLPNTIHIEESCSPTIGLTRLCIPFHYSSRSWPRASSLHTHGPWTSRLAQTLKQPLAMPLDHCKSALEEYALPS